MLVSNCGFPEYEHFDPLVAYFKHLAQSLDKEYIGAILQPMGEILKKTTMQDYLAPYYAGLRKTGKAIIETGLVQQRHVDALKEKWVIKDPNDYQDLANYHYQSKQEQFQQKQLAKKALASSKLEQNNAK
jgi:hypothetical protein